MTHKGLDALGIGVVHGAEDLGAAVQQQKVEQRFQRLLAHHDAHLFGGFALVLLFGAAHDFDFLFPLRPVSYTHLLIRRTKRSDSRDAQAKLRFALPRVTIIILFSSVGRAADC